MNLGVLVSGRGSNLRALLEARVAGRLPQADFALVLSNVAGAPALDIARKHGVAATCIPHADYRGRRGEHDRAVREALVAAGCEAVILAGYMRVIGEDLLAAFPHRLVNIHPSLLPSFPGLHAQQQAIDWGVKVSGCTVHFVDSGVDSGPIILQRTVPVEDADTADTLAARILTVEHDALIEAVDLLTRGRLTIKGRTVHLRQGGTS